MDPLLPMFPLQMVVYPNEFIPLHIFEERYQQLISDSERDGIRFGIPTYIDGKMKYGTEVELKEIVNRYPSGASDVICKGLRVFTIEEFLDPFPGKLYAGARVQYLSNIDDAVHSLTQRAADLVETLYGLLGVPGKDPDAYFDSFKYAHKIGLSLSQEYELLKTLSESDRLLSIIRHLETTIPVVKEMNKARELIQLNGHFRNYDPLDFKEYRIDNE